MKYYILPEFQKRISRLLFEQKIETAIDEIIHAIKEAEINRDEDSVCYLYSQLARVHFTHGKVQHAISALEECEGKYPNNVLAKYLYAENLFWQAKDYKQTIQKAEAVISIIELHLNYYNKALYLKGLAYLEMGRFQDAVDMLKQTQYYDLTLVEKLAERRIGLSECLQFLARALDKFKILQTKGEDVEATILRIVELMSKLSNEV